MNTTSISGWRAFAGSSSRRHLCILATALLAVCGASAQNGNNNNPNNPNVPGNGQTNTTNTTAPATQPMTQSALVPGPVVMQKPAFTVHSVRDVIALQTRSAPGSSALFPWQPSQNFAAKTFINADAIHALKHTPMPLARISKPHVTKTPPPGLWNFPLSGPRAKLAPIEPPKPQP